MDRVTLSQQLLSVLEREERRSWHDIDESWFHLSMDHELISLQPDEEIPESERHTVQSEK
jgi:hypothetical protein